MENLLPEWAPNVHPMLVHFPIAIFVTAILLDVINLLWKKDWMRGTVLTLFVFSALSCFVTYLSGNQAIDIVTVPMRAELTASHHADWALYTLLYFCTYAVIRAFCFRMNLDRKRFIAILLFFGALAGGALIGKTADFGGKLVYKYGVGVQKVK